LPQISKPLLIFTLGFILGYNVTNRAQNLCESKSWSCLTSADGGPCLSLQVIQRMIEKDPDALAPRDVPAPVDIHCNRPLDENPCEVQI